MEEDDKKETKKKFVENNDEGMDIQIDENWLIYF